MKKFFSNKIPVHILSVRLTALFLAGVLLLVLLPLPSSATQTKYGIVRVDSVLNVRSGPGTSYSILGQLGDGDTVVITGTSGSWYCIEYNQATGYVSSDYVEVHTVDVDTEFEAELTKQNFPESYKAGLRLLHAQYPNWKFIAMHTGLDWNDSVTAESQLGVSLVHNSAISSWKSTQDGAYNWSTNTWVTLDSGGWVAASREIIAHYMDPRNFLGSNSVFQFLDERFDGSLQSVSGVETMVSGTFLANSVTDTDGKRLYYPEVIYKAGSTYGVNPYVLASMIIQEQGASGGSDSISGSVSGYTGYFNFFNIGAYATSSMSAIERGLWYAKGGSSGSTSYGRPWNTRYKSIMGGAQNYAENYVNSGQTTLYLKRFNVQGSDPYTFQFMTNVQGAASEGLTLASAYTETMRSSSLSFYIPVYNNMPEEPCPEPTGDGSPNYKLSSLKVNGYSLTPDFQTDTLNYTLVVPYSTASLTISATAYSSKASIQGTGTVSLNVGVNTLRIQVTAENGSVRVYTLTVSRQADSGDFAVHPKYTVSSNTVTGIAPSTTVSAFIGNLGISNGYATVYTAAGSSKASTAKMGTGDIVRIYYADGTRYAEWTVLIYGDTNGDGVISNSDRIKIRNHILGVSTLSGIYRTAADVNKDGKISNSDRILVRNSILGSSAITQ